LRQVPERDLPQVRFVAAGEGDENFSTPENAACSRLFSSGKEKDISGVFF
jgi:hypothetical protein